MVSGDRRPYLVAVIVPDPDFAAEYAGAHALPVELPALAHDAGFHRALGEAVARVNQELAPAERVRRFVIADAPFSLDNSQMTPTLKIRRHAIRAAYGAAFDSLYDGAGIAA
jgi:long-chain acyl-CoA synthetase